MQRFGCTLFLVVSLVAGLARADAEQCDDQRLVAAMLSDENKVCTWLIRLISRYGKGDKPSVRTAFYKLVEQGMLHAFIKPPKDFTSREPKIVQRDYTYPRVKQPWSEGVTILYQVQEDHGK